MITIVLNSFWCVFFGLLFGMVLGAIIVGFIFDKCYFDDRESIAFSSGWNKGLEYGRELNEKK